MILRDPVHGLVAFESEEEQLVEQLLATQELQRLRRIRQLGVASVAFPGAEHSRFSHAIGAAFVMKQLIARLRTLHDTLPFWQRLTASRARDAMAAALLHDLGHGPLSHLFEDALPDTPKHEVWTERILLDDSTEVNRVLRSADPGMPARLAELVHGRDPLPYLASAVSGTFDVDRCDYLLRDAHATGVRYGLFDLDWLLRSLRFSASDDPAIVPRLAIDGAKGLPAIEGFLLARLFMFQQVYLHKATRSAEWMIKQALRRGRQLVADGARLEGTPRALADAARGVPLSLGDYLELDDAVLALTLHAWERCADPALASLCAAIRTRALYKTYELFGGLATPTGQAEALAIGRDLARAHGMDEELSVGLDNATCVPFDEKEPLQVVFQKGPARALREVSFVLARLAGQVLSRVRLVVHPSIRHELVAALAPRNGEADSRV